MKYLSIFIALSITISLTPAVEGDETEKTKEVSKIMENIIDIQDIISLAKKERQIELLKALTRIEPLRKKQERLLNRLNEIKKTSPDNVKEQNSIIIELLNIEEKIVHIKMESLKKIYEIEKYRQNEILERIKKLKKQVSRKTLVKKILKRIRQQQAMLKKSERIRRRKH